MGAAFVQLALTRADIDSFDAGKAEAVAEAAHGAGLPIASVRIEGLARFSEIYTHPRSRESVLHRLEAGARLAGRLGAVWLIIAAKEVVPADVSVPAYRSGLSAVDALLESCRVRLALSPAEGWPHSEAIELAREIARPRVALCLDVPPDAGPDVGAASEAGVEVALLRMLVSEPDGLMNACELDRAGAGDSGLVHATGDPSHRDTGVSGPSGPPVVVVMRSTPAPA